MFFFYENIIYTEVETKEPDAVLPLGPFWKEMKDIERWYAEYNEECFDKFKLRNGTLHTEYNEGCFDTFKWV